jgi:glutamyl-tRNA synthetase
VALLAEHRELAERAIDVERVGVDNPRKDLFRWSDFRSIYGFFFPPLFTPVTDAADERFGGLDPGLVRKLAADYAERYTWADDQPTWFSQIRELAARHGFAPNPKAYKQDPDAYPGMLRDAANVLRVAITGATRSPDLHAVCGALGADEVVRRVRALAG